jgi:hypothetical protein
LTPRVNDQSNAPDEGDSHSLTPSSRDLRKSLRVSKTSLPSFSASSRRLPVTESLDEVNGSAENGNETPPHDSADDTDVDSLQYSNDGFPSTPSKTKGREYRVDFVSPGEDKFPRKRGDNAKHAPMASGRRQPGLLGSSGYKDVGNGVKGENEGHSKRLIRSKRSLREKQNESINIGKDIASAAKSDARAIEQRSEPSGRARKQSRNAVDLEQTQSPVLPSTPASGMKRGRPRKDGSDAAGKSQLNSDSLVFDTASDQIDFLGGQEGEGSRNKRKTPGDGKLGKRPQQYAQRQDPDVQFPSGAHQLTSSTSQTLDPDVPQSLAIAGSKLQAVMDENTSECLTDLKTQILEGLTGKQRLPLIHLEQEYQKVHQLLEQTVLAGEGNSMLIVGSRGTGKTALVETAISDLASCHQDKFYVVRLNGFIQTDDKLALREIWRQLGREMEVEDDITGQRSNYADTLTSLLALLSHSAECTDPELQDHRAMSVIFIIDEFDLFACHPRQTLLYNLFDVAQSRNAPIAVLGLTTKIDVVESLEKRVKSRFGQRTVHLCAPRTFPAFQTICKSALVPQSNPPMQTFAHRLAHSTTITKNKNKNKMSLLSAWSTYIDALFKEDAIFQSFLLRIYTISKSIPTFLTASLIPISLLSPTTLPTGLSFTTHSLSAPDSKLELLPGLSDLDLSLLIAAARLDIVLDSDLCTFGMAYDEYVALASKAKISSSAAGQMATGAGARVWSTDIARAAWERLVALELVVPAIGGSAGGGGSKGEGSRMWRVDVSLEEIEPCVDGLGAVMRKWCREI